MIVSILWMTILSILFSFFANLPPLNHQFIVHFLNFILSIVQISLLRTELLENSYILLLESFVLRRKSDDLIIERSNFGLVLLMDGPSQIQVYMLPNYPNAFIDLDIDSNALLLDIEDMLLKSLYLFNAKLVLLGFWSYLPKGVEFSQLEGLFQRGVRAEECCVIISDGLLKLLL